MDGKLTLHVDKNRRKENRDKRVEGGGSGGMGGRGKDEIYMSKSKKSDGQKDEMDEHLQSHSPAQISRKKYTSVSLFWLFLLSDPFRRKHSHACLFHSSQTVTFFTSVQYTRAPNPRGIRMSVIYNSLLSPISQTSLTCHS